MLHLFFKREIAISSVSQGQSFRVNHTPYLVHVDQMTSFRFALEDEEYSPFPGSNYLSFSLSLCHFIPLQYSSASTWSNLIIKSDV